MVAVRLREPERLRLRLLSVRLFVAAVAVLLVAGCTNDPSGPTTPSKTPATPSTAASPRPSVAAAPSTACAKLLPRLAGGRTRDPAPLDVTGATAAVLCTYVRTSSGSYAFNRRLAVPAKLLPRLIAALNEAEPLYLRVATCALGTPKAVAIYLRERTGSVSEMTFGGPGCGPLFAKGLTLVSSGLASVLASIGY